MRAGFLEIGLALGIEEGRGCVGKQAGRISRCFVALRLDEDRPARTEPTECVVEPPGDGDQLGGDGGIQVGATEARRALETPVLVEDDAFSDERVWGYEQSLNDEHLSQGLLWWGADGQSKMPRLKRFRTGVSEGTVPSSWWPRELAGDNQQSKRELIELFDGRTVEFATPKPTSLWRRAWQK